MPRDKDYQLKRHDFLLNNIYRKLYARFGPQHWWPAESPFEVMVGAILTQNTNWANVAKAIDNLKRHKVLTVQKLYRLRQKRLAGLIRSAGYYNIKARRLKNFLDFFIRNYQGNIRKLSRVNTQGLRAKLLSVNGIGQETADSILLYALNKPVFVADAYTRRILSRHKIVKPDAGYPEIQKIFTQNLKEDQKLFNEYHALLVRLGKDFCLKNKPKCDTCPLKN
jgi:endonuclease-3 related protein